MNCVAVRYPRIACLVPGCRRGSTLYPPDHTILCAKHYRLVDAELKRRRRAARRHGRERLDAMLWRRMARQAIERAAGL